MRRGEKWEDTEILRVLFLTEREGLSFEQASLKASKEFGRKVTRSSLAGIISRVNAQADKHKCACEKAENKNGGMPQEWWIR